VNIFTMAFLYLQCDGMECWRSFVSVVGGGTVLQHGSKIIIAAWYERYRKKIT